jgi:hypothetical protein
MRRIVDSKPTHSSSALEKHCNYTYNLYRTTRGQVKHLMEGIIEYVRKYETDYSIDFKWRQVVKKNGWLNALHCY